MGWFCPESLGVVVGQVGTLTPEILTTLDNKLYTRIYRVSHKQDIQGVPKTWESGKVSRQIHGNWVVSKKMEIGLGVQENVGNFVEEMKVAKP